MKPITFALCVSLLLTPPLATANPAPLAGLKAFASVIRDHNGIPHIQAANEHDLFFLQGRVHAEDRLFQMDMTRRSAAGTLAELFGPSVLQSDIETRTIGLGRAAVRSLAAHPPAMLAILEAYAAGVNSFINLAEEKGSLPPEYGALGLTRVERWQAIDSVLVGKALAALTSLVVTEDIDLTVALKTYEGIAAASGGAFDGRALFFEDLFRSAPFAPAVTVPDAKHRFAANPLAAVPSRPADGEFTGIEFDSAILAQAKSFGKRIRQQSRTAGALHLDGEDMTGSNTWVIAGTHTRSGRPLLANDMHLALPNPAIFHEIALQAPGFQASGHSLAGAPCVVRGHNRDIAWGVTNARLDINDVYAEVIQADTASPSGYSTLHDGVAEPIIPIIESFFVNLGGEILPAPAPYTQVPVLIVPRRNQGPLITAPEQPGPLPGTFTALSLQSVGFGPTRDPEGVCAVNRAGNLDEFREALQLIDFASQNFTYADRDGNIAYFVSGEVPQREDLRNPAGPIAPPYLIRNGYSGNNWATLVGERPANQATAFEILPFAEMPQVINPRGGVIVNANNDPLGHTLDNNPLNDPRADGDGLRYLNWGGRNFSIRAERISELIETELAGGQHKLTRRQMQAMQADIQLNDARALAPYIVAAFEQADGSAHPALAPFAADPRLDEAVNRLRQWDYTTPTGLEQAHDAIPQASVEASIATSIYSVWRGLLAANSIDATLARFGGAEVPRPRRREEIVTALAHLLERNGVGVSGLDFFAVPGVAEAAVRRDIIILQSLTDALNLMASAAFEPAFAGSTNQDDYRWGKLHRVVLRHPLGEVEGNFNAPPAFGMLPPSIDGLAGIAIDGGYETVDEAPPRTAVNIRVEDSDSMLVEFGPAGRFVAHLGRHRINATSSLPGGNSAVPGSPFYLNLLEPWLDNKSYRIGVSARWLQRNAYSIEGYAPAAR